MATTQSDITSRLRQWALKEFGGVGKFARAMGIANSTASQYLAGWRIPGNLVQARLRKLGAPVEWIMSGEGAVKEVEGDQGEKIWIYAPDGVSEFELIKYRRIAKLLTEASTEDLDVIHTIIKSILKHGHHNE